MSLQDFFLALAPGIKDERRRRFDEYVAKNPEMGGQSQEEYNSALKEYIRTGQFPTSRPQEVRTTVGDVQEVPNPEGGIPIRVLPTTEVSMQDKPIMRGTPSYSFNQKTGQYEETPVSIPRGAEVRQFKPDGQSYAIGYDDSGNVVKQTPIQGDRDISYRIGELASRERGRGGKGGLSPKEQAWKIAYDKAVRALMPRYDIMGKPIPPEIDQNLLQAGIDGGQGLGVDTSFLENALSSTQERSAIPPPEPEKPGMWSRLFSGTPAEDTRPADSSPAGERPGGAVKSITKEIAAQILKEAGGDKNKARQIAKSRGYKF